MYTQIKDIFTDNALNLYSLPEGYFTDYDSMIGWIEGNHPEDLQSEVIEDNFGSQICDYETILTSKLIDMYIYFKQL